MVVPFYVSKNIGKSRIFICKGGLILGNELKMLNS